MTSAPEALRRTSAGTYETLDGRWTILRSEAANGWVAYLTDDSETAHLYRTLKDAREAVSEWEWARTGLIRLGLEGTSEQVAEVFRRWRFQ